jgi:hypothetical protein
LGYFTMGYLNQQNQIKSVKAASRRLSCIGIFCLP